jgi:hypothetical protein
VGATGFHAGKQTVRFTQSRREGMCLAVRGERARRMTQHAHRSAESNMHRRETQLQVSMSAERGGGRVAAERDGGRVAARRPSARHRCSG